ncbi:ABC transporter permease [Oceanirhabdus sp. W0125-5]|uniref:ABC transporter permease n=1 Tax=Oceanirhabdus sp. W0125-5 TaxID=2999116 RepID=UPI0022F2B9C8|nr:ABC transporter permease [Oceanirhabdus sp. W0125-5]WBW95673.1 ABC transporter permease [Oceanirhabdus sp. W0125-5]
MQKYVIRRILMCIPVLIGISLIIFLLVNAMPGNPFSHMIDPKMTVADKEAMLRSIGFYDPIHVKYFKWIGQVLQGNLGYSIRYNTPVTQVIGERLPFTFVLAFLSLLVSTAIAIPFGVISSSKKNSFTDYAVTFISFFGISIPAFFFGLLLVKIFAVDLKIFPISGVVSAGAGYTGLMHIWDMAMHLFLPTMMLSLLSIAQLMRYTRSSMLEVLNMDYIRTARAKGLSEKVVIYKHALRNGLIPVITMLTLQISGLFGGALMTETIFSLPGMGKLMFQSVNNRDYPLIMGCTMMMAVVVLLSNLLADILYAFIDPRIKYD